MRPQGRSVRFLRGLLLTTAVVFVIISTSHLIQDVIAAETAVPDLDTSDPGFVYTNDIPTTPSFDTSFKPKHVHVVFINEHYDGFTYGATVQDALHDLGIKLDEEHASKPSLDFVLTEDTSIRIYSVTRERKAEVEEIPFSAVTVLDDTREIDTTSVVQTGRPGQKRIMYEHTYINGILDSTKAIREETLSIPQDEVTAIGTMRVFREMTVDGDTFEYWRIKRVYATTYDSTCEGCSTRTATGATLMKGVCAVDPTVIPMFSKFYVPGYGFCQALDVGGAIKGDKIDMGFESLAAVQGSWSAHYVDIYLLD